VIEVIPELVEVQGHMKVKLMIRDGQTVLDVDLVNPFNAAQRRKAAERLADRAGQPHAAEQIERAVLQCVELLGAAADKKSDDDGGGGGGGGDDGGGGADDAASTAGGGGPITVVRPELVITREVVAVSVPEVFVKDGQAMGRWRIYLRTVDPTAATAAAAGDAGDAGDGTRRRESRPLSARLLLGGGGGGASGGRAGGTGADAGTLWVHPVPPAPSPATSPGWTQASRKAWLDGVDGADVVSTFDDLIAVLAEYLDVDESGATATATATAGAVAATPHPLIATLALWTMLTYVYVAWDAVPYLFVTGPAGSGKTRVFELLSRLVFRPLASSNLSAAALFRTLHDRGGTLLLDEAERLSDGGDDVAELRSILLAGYKRGGRASRLESSGSNYEMNEFCVFGPKAIACINAIPPALASRCIPVQMFRAPPGSPKPRRRIDADPARWVRLRDALYQLTLGALGGAALALAERADCCPLGGRQYELWQPVLAMAAWIDELRHQRAGRGITPGAEPAPAPEPAPEPLHPRVLEYARRLCDRAAEGLLPEEDFLLLWTLTDRALRSIHPTCKMILDVARRADPDAMRGVSARRVAEILKRYGLQTARSHGKSIYKDVLDQLRTVESRYGVDLNTDGKDTISVARWGSYCDDVPSRT
jgi:hypothetical protein